MPIVKILSLVYLRKRIKRMKFKLKNLAFYAGKPVALIPAKTADELNIHIGDRVLITASGKAIIAVADLAKNFLRGDEVSLSKETLSFLRVKAGASVDIKAAPTPESTGFILKKLRGKSLSKEEIRNIVQDIVENALLDAEIAYFVSAVYEQGMNFHELVSLTQAMCDTGSRLRWGSHAIADKHSIGGVAGNRTTPLVISICAVAGILLPKTSSRAITSASGTADVMETITHVEFSPEELQKIVRKTGACFAWGGSLGLAPADDKLIRVERLLNVDPESQLIASILSKKLATGSTHVLIDIPYGWGAKVSYSQARRLKNTFLKLGNHFGIEMRVVLTDGSQPIGNGIGPLLEIRDVLSVLHRKDPPKDLERKSLYLAGILLEMMKKAKRGEGEHLAQRILDSGAAFEKFNEILIAQGRKPLPRKLARYHSSIFAKQNRIIRYIDNRKINLLARLLGCPQDKASGIYLHKHIGDAVKRGDTLLTFYAESKKKLKEALHYYHTSLPLVLSTGISLQ